MLDPVLLEVEGVSLEEFTEDKGVRWLLVLVSEDPREEVLCPEFSLPSILVFVTKTAVSFGGVGD